MQVKKLYILCVWVCAQSWQDDIQKITDAFNKTTIYGVFFPQQAFTVDRVK